MKTAPEVADLTLRDYFAAAAATGLAASQRSADWKGEDVAAAAYALADELLKWREQGEGVE